jgi:Tfp pilus assembly protein PilE
VERVMEILKEEKGITLLSLVITIIVLIILAGITINSLTGSHVLQKGREATSQTVIDQEEDILVQAMVMAHKSLISGDDVDYSNNKVNLDDVIKESGKLGVEIQEVSGSEQGDTVKVTVADTSRVYKLDLVELTAEKE